jgi:DNA-binding beta-propeller fold protein YncE/mono/diheme cytochrome c family protein
MKVRHMVRAKRSPLVQALASVLSGVALLCAAGPPALAQIVFGDRPAYRSPIDLAYSADGSLLAVADRTWPGLVLINPADGSVVREVKLLGDPYSVAWNGSSRVLVAEGTNGTVAEIDVASGTVLGRVAIGSVAKGLAITSDGQRLLTCDRAGNKLVVVKLGSGTIESTIDVGREPGTVAVSKDGKVAFVGNKLPRSASPLNGTPAAEISIVDLTTKQVRAVPLVRQATMVRQVVLSPDGRWAYVTHQSPRGGLPVTQLDNGWVMTNALSIIDTASGSLYANFIFDRSGSGAAHPWGAVISADGSKLWVTLEGVREVATVDLASLHKRLSSYTAQQRIDLIVNLSDLHSDGTIKRTPLSAIDGPRGLALSPDGTTLALAGYFSGKVLLLSAGDLSVSKTISLPNNPAEDQIRAGERYYYSAMNCYQTWLSCSTCHDEGRPDGLNWDLQNDGTGNPKQTKSHIYSAETPPTNVSGCRENAEVSSRAGYQNIEFQAAPEERVQATYAFIKALQPEPSPFLGPDGQLTSEAVEGKKIFEGPGGCSGCHKGQYFTDMQKHDVGTRRFGTEGPDNNPTWDTAGWDTPSLIEVWRTAPYLHLGSALTVRDVLTVENQKGMHGNAAQLTPQQIDQLVAYVMQIGPTRPRVAAPEILDAAAPASDAVPNQGVDATGSSSGGTPGFSTEGLGGAPTSGSMGGNSGGNSAASAGGANAESGPRSSSCICAMGAHAASGGNLPFALMVVLFVTARLGRARRPPASR